jgi:RNA-splicing ligase RtcB
MRICQDFARLNRLIIAEIIIKKMNIAKSVDFQFETIHNYIDSHNIVRKGAIDASKDKIVLIPINMKDGCIIAQGLGNDDWNNSAPHGAGRLMSRSKAKKDLDIDTFKNDMAGIFSSTVNRSTLDESPRAYKSMEEIIETTKDTIKITKIIKPIYNFKAAE